MNESNQFITPADVLSGWIITQFKKAFSGSGQDFENISVVQTANPEFGDFQCNDCMQLAKTLKQAPHAIAQALVDNMELHEAVEKVDVAGPGFINIHLKPEWLSSVLERMGSIDNLGVEQVGRGPYCCD